MKKAREGYKMTELGEIPKEWEVKRLIDCSIGKPQYGLGVAAVEYDKNLPTYLRITDIDENGNFDKKNKASVNSIEYSKYILKQGDIVFARTGNTVGKNYLYKEEDGELVYAGFLIKFSINKEKIDPRYIKKYCETKKYWDWVKMMSLRSGQPGINAEEYSNLLIPIPPLPEQQKIADILSTVDEQIENVDKLIEKTKELKKGLMQRLLNKGIGHKEFKKTEVGVIPKEWEVKKLGEVCELINGRAFKPSEWSEVGLPIVRIQNLNGSNEFNFYKGNIEEKFVIEKNELLFSWSGSKGTSFGPFIWRGNTAVLNQHIFRVLLKENYYKNYIYYALKSLTEVIEEKAHGSAGLVHITKKTLEEFKIKIPMFKEQQKIADILSSVDDQLEEYQANKEKLELLKKGLMQKLLTGKIRIKIL